MQELKHRPGCFGILAGIITLCLFGGLGYVFETYLGIFSGWISMAGLVVAIAVGIGVARKTRWAVILSGLFLLIAGAALAIFIMVDFVSSLQHGESRMPGAGGTYGQSVAIILATGVALAMAGVYLIRGKSIAELLE
jgi:TRAP-type mannitol/chloroaromatic compound transport system permease small subunit